MLALLLLIGQITVPPPPEDARLFVHFEHQGEYRLLMRDKEGWHECWSELTPFDTARGDWTKPIQESKVKQLLGSAFSYCSKNLSYTATLNGTDKDVRMIGQPFPTAGWKWREQKSTGGLIEPRQKPLKAATIEKLNAGAFD